MSNWRVFSKKCDFFGMGAALGVDPVVVRIMRNRDLTDIEQMKEFLCLDEDLDAEDRCGYEEMIDIHKAVNIICNKISENANIRIIGDYDVDGIMSTYILRKGLSLCGARVDSVIPHRIRDGYGISVSLIEEAYADGIDTIITCDNGISAVKAFEHALELNMTCIITDHHDVPFQEVDGVKEYILPPVPAIVNPKREECVYPYKGVCGAVVALKVMECLFDTLETGHECLPQLRELAGFATVCDVMELRGENRALVRYTLSCLPNSHNIGLKALVKECELEGKKINSYSVGFVLGPCINATGRLESANLSLDLLMSNTIEEGLVLARKLRELNEKRKKMTEDGIKEAQEVIMSGDSSDKVLVVYLPRLHESLAGIVAGRIKEKYYKPTFVITDGREGLKGSARSIEEYHIYEAMTQVKDVFTLYGGHAMAAGFSLEKDRLEEFRRRINENCTLTPEDLQRKIVIDVPMPMSYVTERLVEQLSLLEPFGNGNPKPVFAQKSVKFLSGRIFGKNNNVGKFKVITADGYKGEVVMFHELQNFMEVVDKKYGKGSSEALLASRLTKDIVMDVIYYPDINEFQGRKSLQFVINDFM